MTKHHVATNLYDRKLGVAQLSPAVIDEDVKELKGLYKAIATVEFSSSAAKIFGMRRRHRLPPDSGSSSATCTTLIQVLARICGTGALKASSRATDARDRIFALSGMSSQSLDILTDYSLSCSSVYTLAARAVIMSGEVDLLSFSQSRGLTIRCSFMGSRLEGRVDFTSKQETAMDTAFRASGASVLQTPPDVGSLSSDQLTLNGCLVGFVETCRKP